MKNETIARMLELTSTMMPELGVDIMGEIAIVAKSNTSNNVLWDSTTREVEVIYHQMCEINETPSKEQTPKQKEALQKLRAECVAIHNRRIQLCQDQIRITAKAKAFVAQLTQIEAAEYRRTKQIRFAGTRNGKGAQ